jgi:hypothetical protein
MTDDVILRMIKETCEILKVMEFHEDCRPLMPTYTALIAAAQENHPQDPFIRTISSVEDIGVDPNVMRILFTQLRIALESFRAVVGDAGEVALLVAAGQEPEATEQAETPAEFEAITR